MPYTLIHERCTNFIVGPDGKRVEQHADSELAAERLAYYNSRGSGAVAGPAAVVAEPAADLAPGMPAVLEGNVGSVRAALEAGDLDGMLAELLAAEREHKCRRTVIAAIEARMG